MNTNRSLAFALCAVIVTTFFSATTVAQVDIALNLRYVHPGDTNQGGDWTLVAKTSDANGLASISAVIDDIDLAGIVFGAGINADIGDTAADGTVVNIVYGQDLNDGPVEFGVGTGAGTGGNQSSDPLDVQGFGPGTWDHVAVIATGTFGNQRPSFTSNANFGGSTAAFNLNAGGTTGVPATIGLLNVRGDSLNLLLLESPISAGLLGGDTDRDNDVDIADLGTLALGLSVGMGGWDDGDVQFGGGINIADLGTLASNLGFTSTPPAVSAVPESSSAALAILGLSVLAIRRRK